MDRPRMLIRLLIRALVLAGVVLAFAACTKPPLYVCTPLQPSVIVCQPATRCGDGLCVYGPE